MRKPCAPLLLGFLLASCDARSLVVGESPTSNSFGGDAPSGAQRCADTAELRVSDGECWPTRHVGRWRGLVTGAARYRHVLAEPFTFPSGELILELGAEGTGTLLFASPPAGEPCAADAGASDGVLTGSDAAADAGASDGALTGSDAAADAGVSSCAASDAGAPGGVRAGLLLDYRYTLDNLRMSGGPPTVRRQDPRLEFSLLIAAPWLEVCSSSLPERAVPPCICVVESCTASPELLEVSLFLSRDGQALRGSVFSSSAPELTADMELVRQ